MPLLEGSIQMKRQALPFVVRQTVGQHDDVVIAAVAVHRGKLPFIMNRRIIGTEIVAGIE